MTHHRAAHASRASEAGFALLEVVVSAAVFAVVAVAVLAGIDGAQSSTGREKSRSVAANLAERDQERMRAMQVDTLADYTLTATENVDGNAFTIVSTGEWVRDDTGGTVELPERLHAGGLPPHQLDGDEQARRHEHQAHRHPEPRGPVGGLPRRPRLARRAGQRPQRRRRPRHRRVHRRSRVGHRHDERVGLRGLRVHRDRQLQHHAQPPGLGRPLRQHRVGRQPGRHVGHAQHSLDGLRPRRVRTGDGQDLQAELDHPGGRQRAELLLPSALGHQQR